MSEYQILNEKKHLSGLQGLEIKEEQQTPKNSPTIQKNQKEDDNNTAKMKEFKDFYSQYRG